MLGENVELAKKLEDLMQRTGYNIIQKNGQRKFGPPPDWNGPPPQRGCEVFVGKLPRDIFEDELVPVFMKAGWIYEMRLMMNFSGLNRGYAFVTYSSKTEAAAAVKDLHGYEIRPGWHIGVVISVNNCRLFISGIPNTMSKKQLFEELTKKVSGIVDVILDRSYYDTRLNRGFAFVEFTTHRAAAMARRSLIPGHFKLWGQEIMVDWAELEQDKEDNHINGRLRLEPVFQKQFSPVISPPTSPAQFHSAVTPLLHPYSYVNLHHCQGEPRVPGLQSVAPYEINMFRDAHAPNGTMLY